MGFDGFPDEGLAFYEGLLADNSKAYWTDNKDVYERAVKQPMQALVEALGDGWGEPKIFRPHRDVRFSADKSPYKAHQGAFFEVVDGVGYYVQLDADGLYVAGGFYAHSKDQTARYRSAVDAPATGGELVKIATKLLKAGFQLGGDQVKTRPRGVPADHPRLALMRHECLVASRRHEPSASLHTAATLSVIRRQWRSLQPLMEWIQENVTASGKA
jgi:uncharacterized protein (TIGR02453 family)